MPRIHALSRVNFQSRVSAAIRGGTNIGAVIDVQIVKILDQYGLEIAIPKNGRPVVYYQRRESVCV